MTQAELNRAVAAATGETVATIAQRGFSLLTAGPVEREPLAMDWDSYDEERFIPFARPKIHQPVAA
jgi:hypothetical protein